MCVCSFLFRFFFGLFSFVCFVLYFVLLLLFFLCFLWDFVCVCVGGGGGGGGGGGLHRSVSGQMSRMVCTTKSSVVFCVAARIPAHTIAFGSD